jgi:hypothetical protein
MSPGEALEWVFVAAMAMLTVVAGFCFYKFIRE